MSLSNHESDKVSSATQTRVNVVTHRGGYARNWPLLPGNGGRADSQGGRESEKSCEECGLLLLVLGEKERTRELLLGKATSSTHPKLKQLQKRRIRRDLARTERAAEPRTPPAPGQLLCPELQPALVQFRIHTRCLGMLWNTSCPWFFISSTESHSQN